MEQNYIIFVNSFTTREYEKAFLYYNGFFPNMAELKRVLSFKVILIIIIKNYYKTVILAWDYNISVF